MSVTEKAKELGETLSQSREFLEMKAVEEKVIADHHASALIQKYQQTREEMAELLSENPADSEKLEAASKRLEVLEEAVSQNALLTQWMEKQQQFAELIDKVNRILHFYITGETEPEGGCGGNCQSCRGCH